MAIDARLLLAGVVPDVADSAAKGFALGQGIRNTPILRQMQQQKLAQGEQGLAQDQQLAAQNEMKLGRASAQAINSVIGDSTAEQITPDVFAQSTRALADLGVPLDDDDLTFSPENVANLLKISAAGKQINLEGRGAAAKRVFEGDFTFKDSEGNIFSQQTFADPNTTETKSSLTDVSGRGLTPVGKLTPIQTTGETIQEKRIQEVTQKGEETKIVEQTKVDVVTGSAEKVGGAQAKIASLKESAVLDARDLNTLKKTSGARKRNIIKAESFRDALQTGLRTSGVGRKAALFAPIGVWTDQGSFDEIFNAFAEVAAREQLKASGEVRPTDADVQGMKGAMFGVGRSEEANLQLLNEFIEEQKSLETSLESSVSKSNQAKAPTVTTQAQFNKLPSGSLYLEDGVQYRKP